MEYIIKRLQTNLNITGIVNIHFFEFDKNFTTADERHPFYELVFVNTGKLQIISESYTGKLSKDQLIIHRPNDSHSLRCSDETNPTVIIIGFECDTNALEVLANTPITLNESAIKKLAEIVKEARNVFAPPFNIPTHNMKKKKKQSYGAEQMLKILLEYFLLKLVREYYYNENIEENLRPPLSQSELVEYVDLNYRERITIEELAFLFKTNRSTLCKEFKAATGKTLVEYINEKKIGKAKKMIAESNDSFTKIAEDLHFDSIHYFTRLFKKLSGMTPTEYRAEHKKQSQP